MKRIEKWSCILLCILMLACLLVAVGAELLEQQKESDRIKELNAKTLPYRLEKAELELEICRGHPHRHQSQQRRGRDL